MTINIQPVIYNKIISWGRKELCISNHIVYIIYSMRSIYYSTCFSKMREISPRVLSRPDTLLLAHCPPSWPCSCFNRPFTMRCNLKIQEHTDKSVYKQLFLIHFVVLPQPTYIHYIKAGTIQSHDLLLTINVTKVIFQATITKNFRFEFLKYKDL